MKNLLANAGDVGLIPRWERSPGEGNGTPLQYFCLGKTGKEKAGMGCIWRGQEMHR